MDTFDPAGGVIVVTAVVHGPSRAYEARLALDTGATTTLIPDGVLAYLGIPESDDDDSAAITTAGGVVWIRKPKVPRLEAPGQHRTLLPVIRHTLPPSAGVDGLLGLDFLRGHRLTIDFTTGSLVLE